MIIDHLKRIGINTCKNSIQLKRLFDSHKLEIIENENAIEQQVLNIIKNIANLNNFDEIVVEYPKCKKCMNIVIIINLVCK